jgi:citrate lyase subunit beta / citryl-CoA lyase
MRTFFKTVYSSPATLSSVGTIQQYFLAKWCIKTMFERSYHFIPASKHRLFDRADKLGADSIIFDFEDSVAGTDKKTAIDHLNSWLSKKNHTIPYYVRVNGVDHAVAAAERDLLTTFPNLGIVLPKLESGHDLKIAVDYYSPEPDRSVIGLIESAKGLLALTEILQTGLLHAVGLGLEDFFSESIFSTGQLYTIIAQIRSKVALQAMAHAVNAIDTISLDLTGGEALHADIKESLAAGMTAKFSIHPSQITAINQTFSPGPESIKDMLAYPGNLDTASDECGYQPVGDMIISPPKLKKLKEIRRFSARYAITR